jgi:phytoene dehydrogenase-like protein
MLLTFGHVAPDHTARSRRNLRHDWRTHGELALDQVFTMRPFLDWARYRTPIQNLYLCGSGTHPGIGLSGGSGANAAREILKDLKAKR